MKFRDLSPEEQELIKKARDYCAARSNMALIVNDPKSSVDEKQDAWKRANVKGAIVLTAALQIAPSGGEMRETIKGATNEQ